MINEVARALTDWFNDPTNGIVAVLATLPRDGGDALPTVGTIADQTRDTNVAQKNFPSIPGIAVNVLQIPVLDGENNTVAGVGTADVLVRIARSNQDASIAVAETSYILRAMMISWRRFFSTFRTRNSIQIYHCDNFAIAPDWVLVENAIVTGAANANVEFRDLLA